MDDREKDARAAEAVGWKLDYEFEDMLGAPTVPHLRDQYDEWGILPHFGSDPAAARLLLEAVPQNKRVAVLNALIHNVAPGIEYDWFQNWDATAYADLWALVLAPPAAIRDSVLEVMDG